MKNRDINLIKLFAFVIAGIILAGIFLFLNRDPYDYTRLEYLSISYFAPFGGIEEYRLQKTDGKWTAVYDNGAAAETMEFETESPEIQRVRNYLRSKKVGKWKSFNNPLLSAIPDGTFYHFNAEFSDGKSIDVDTYMTVPGGYYEVWDAIAQLFDPDLQDS